MGLLAQLRQDFTGVLCNRKPTLVDLASTPLKRCLNLLDLTFLNIGGIIGAGIFVFAGRSIRSKAGPGIILSFVVAGIPAFIAALCFAEFGSRVPKAGSTYDYVFVALGEFWAALVGWYLISAPVFTGAAISRTWAGYFDTMFGGWIANRTMETVGSFNVPGLAPYPDFLAAGLVLLMGVIVASGAKLSTVFNSVFGVTKLIVIGFIVCYGLSFADGHNWTNSQNGGFLPFGFSGVMAAAPTAFFAYGGYDRACAACEEAKNPKRDIVWSIVIALGISALVYILMCTTLTLMIPFDQVAPTSSFADAFEVRGAPWAKYVVAIGALSALTTVLFASIFPVPRYIYAMASDGLIFQWLAVVNQRTRVPIRGISIYVIITLIVMLLFDLEALVEFLSMGGLLCEALVASSVIILRYRPREANSRAGLLKENYTNSILGKIFGGYPGGVVVVAAVSTQIFLMAALSAIFVYAPWHEPTRPLFCILMIVLAVLVFIIIGVQFLIWTFVQNEDEHLWFRVPLVPFLPSICMLMNILLILYLTPMTWLRFSLYLLVGATIYAVYGIRHSIHQKQVHPILQISKNSAEKEEQTKV